jgi:hypothetical protein
MNFNVDDNSSNTCYKMQKYFLQTNFKTLILILYVQYMAASMS